jgi:glycosyltransferase involved in cell wall biosynthesis
MRILWFNHRDPQHPQAGGAEVRIHEIGKRLVNNGCTIKLICEQWDSSNRVDMLDGIQIERVAGKYNIHLLVPFLLRKYQDYDIVVDDIAHAVPWFSPLHTSIPVVGQIHHVHQEVLLYELQPWLARIIAQSERSLRYFYKTMIAVSESTKQDVVTKLGFPGNQIHVIHNGVTPEYSPREKHSKPTLIYVGRIKRYKRIDHILTAFKRVKTRIPATRLLIVGDGDYINAAKKLYDKLELSDCHFLGYVSQLEKIQLLASSWIILNASMIEGWGMTITEGGACGTPAIAYDVPGIRDCVQDGITGLLAQNGNITDLTQKITTVLQEEKVRKRLSEHALSFSRKFNWKTSASSFLRVLERAINDS